MGLCACQVHTPLRYIPAISLFVERGRADLFLVSALVPFSLSAFEGEAKSVAGLAGGSKELVLCCFSWGGMGKHPFTLNLAPIRDNRDSTGAQLRNQ